MRRSTVILGAIFALMLALCALFLLGGTLSGRVSAMTASGADYPQAYASIRQLLEADDVPQRLTEPLPPDPASCRLEDVTLTLANPGLFDAEWVYVYVDGAPGDVAVYSISGEGKTISARGEDSVNLKLISNVSGTRFRTYHVQYYIYGMKREITVTQQADGM